MERLEAFANSCEMEGEKLIAVETVSVFNRYFGQWLALRSPFRTLEELIDPAVAEKAAPRQRGPEHWSDEEAVTKELELEAMGVAKKAERHLVEQYLAGHTVKGDAAGAHRSLEEAGFPVPDEGLELNRQQQLLRDSVLGDAERAAKARAAQDADELDDIREAAAKNARPLAGLGPPGTGKTTVLNSCVDQILESGGRVLYALPTAQLAARRQTPDRRRGHLRRGNLAVEREGGRALGRLGAVRVGSGRRGLAAGRRAVRTDPADVGSGRQDPGPGLRRRLLAVARRQRQPGHAQPEVAERLRGQPAQDVALQGSEAAEEAGAPADGGHLSGAQGLDARRRPHFGGDRGGAAPPPGHDSGHMHAAEGSRRQSARHPSALREDAKACLGTARPGLGGQSRAAQGDHAKAAPARDLR